MPAASNRMVPVSLTLQRGPDQASGSHPIALHVDAYPEDAPAGDDAHPVARLQERAIFTLPR